jgi:hypothetical protein
MPKGKKAKTLEQEVASALKGAIVVEQSIGPFNRCAEEDEDREAKEKRLARYAVCFLYMLECSSAYLYVTHHIAYTLA